MKPRSLLAVAFLAASLWACGAPGTQAPTVDASLTIIPSDPVRPATAAESSRAVSKSVALQAAASSEYDWPNPDAYLVVMTYAATEHSASPIVDRLIWLLRWDDLYIPMPRPINQDGSLPSPPVSIYTHGYVGVDAITGVVAFNTFMA